MVNKGEYSVETLARIRREMGLFTSELLFCYPSRIERNLSIMKDYSNSKGIDYCHYIIDILREEAENILKSKGYKTDLKSLKSIKDYDIMTEGEDYADIQISNAKQVLISANNMKKISFNIQDQKIFIETLRLLAAAMTSNAQYIAWLGIRDSIGKTKGRQKVKMLRGILVAVEEYKQENIKPTFGGFWKKITHSKYSKSTPYEVNGYSLYVENDVLYHIEIMKGKKGVKSQKVTLRKKSSVERYFNDYVKMPESLEYSQASGVNGFPMNPNHPWNRK